MRTKMIVAGVLLFIFSGSLFCMKRLFYNNGSQKNLTEHKINKVKEKLEWLLGDMRCLFPMTNVSKIEYGGKAFEEKNERNAYMDELFAKEIAEVWKHCDAGTVAPSIEKRWEKAMDKHEKRFICDSDVRNDQLFSLFINRLTIQRLSALSVVFKDEKFSVRTKAGTHDGGMFRFGNEDARCRFKGPYVDFWLKYERSQTLPLIRIKAPYAGPLSDYQIEILGTKQDVWG